MLQEGMQRAIDRLLKDIKSGNGFIIREDLSVILRLDPECEWWNIHTSDGKHILEFALESGSHESVIAYFLKQKPQLNFKISGEPILHYCIQQKMPIGILDLLLKNGVDISEKNQDGKTIFDVVDAVFPIGSNQRLGILELLKHSSQYGKILKSYLEDHKNELKSYDLVSALVENSESCSYYELLEKFLGKEESDRIFEQSRTSGFISGSSSYHVTNLLDDASDKQRRYEDGLEICAYEKFSAFFNLFEQMAHVQSTEFTYTGLTQYNCNLFD